MEGASLVSVRAVRRDERGDGDGGAVGKELGYFADSADVFVAVLLGEAEVLVQSESYVVAVKTVRGDAQVQEVLLESYCHGGLAGGGETGEPEGQAALLAELVALFAQERGVPCDVAVEQFIALAFFIYFIFCFLFSMLAWEKLGWNGDFGGVVRRGSQGSCHFLPCNSTSKNKLTERGLG